MAQATAGRVAPGFRAPGHPQCNPSDQACHHDRGGPKWWIGGPASSRSPWRTSARQGGPSPGLS